mmetsp:Transcript_2013/g.2667  ORF Transcript_2013/g.2667 Transcript_2013/m.2667 type:complete len:353 (+) Transcript_2013:126-1184(+)
MRGYGRAVGDTAFHLQQDVPVPKPNQGEALVRVLLAGICATDLEIVKGYKAGFHGILGHEFVGTVVSANGDSSGAFPTGTRVVGEINICCSRVDCRACQSGDLVLKRNHCENRKVLGIFNHNQGAFSEYLTMPLENLHVVPDKISNRIAAFTEPFAAACRIIEQNLIQPGDKVAVIGDGRLGLLIALVFCLTCEENNLTLIGKHEEKMNILESNQIKKIVLDDDTKIASDSFDIVIVATASIRGVEMATKIVRPLGKIIEKTTCSPAGSNGCGYIDVLNDIVVKEIMMIGSRCGPFATALTLMKEHYDDVERVLSKMISSSYPLKDIDQAIADASQKGTIKVQIQMAAFTNE